VSRNHFRSWGHKSNAFYLDGWFTFDGNLLITFLYLFRFFCNALCSLFNYLFDWLRRLFFEIWPFFNRHRNVMHSIDCNCFSFLVNFECLVSYFNLFFQLLDDFLAIYRLV
jgi:hypothetical protein